MTAWTRPETVPFPSTWRTFEGRKIWNGHKRHYWIQDITEEYADQIVHYMCTVFVRDEPLCMYSGLADDNEDIEESGQVWRGVLAKNTGLVCLTKDENSEIKVAGVNLTCLSFKDDKDDFEVSGVAKNSHMGLLIKCFRNASMFGTSLIHEVKSELSRKLYDTYLYMCKKVDPFEKFGLTAYLSAMGLLVLPEFRGEGIGLELLKAREPLSRALGLKATLTVFTSHISQGLAAKAGFKDLYSVSYADLGKITGHIYPGIEKHTKDIKFMYLLYE